MSEQLGKLKPVDRALKQSLLNLKDQMSVYSTQPWSAENGHGYNEAEQFSAMREGPMIVGRGSNINTRQPNAMERRRNTEREIDLHSLSNVQCHFENPRNKLPGPPVNVPPPGVEYGCPPGRPPGAMPVENGYRDDNFRRDTRPYIDIDRSRTDPGGYYKGQGRPQYGPDGRSYHGMEGGGFPLPPYEGDVGGPRSDFRHLPPSSSSYSGAPRGLLPHPTDDRNQGLRRGYDSYSSSSPSGSSWSPTDSSGSPNAYPPPPPSRLRHSESFPPDARRASFGIDRAPPYNHPHLNNRSPTDGQWRGESQRRHARSTHPDDDYFFPRRVDFIGPPPYPLPPSHLRDPRLNRGVPSPSHSGCSPQSHNQPQSTTSSPRVNSSPTRRPNISRILDEHSYFEKCEPDEVPSNTSSKTCPTATSQQESQVDSLGLPRHMLSPVPRVYSVIMNKSTSPLNSRTEVLEKAYVSIEPRGSIPTSKELKDVLALVASSSAADSKSISKEASIKQDSKNIAMSGVEKEVSKKEPPVSATKESPCPSDEESDQLKDDELDTDQTPQNKTPDSGYPDSPAVSLSDFVLDLDSEPMSSGSSDEEEEQASETDVHSEDEILPLAPTSFISNRKSRKTGTTTQEEVEVEPSKTSQSNSRVLRNRILPCSTTSTAHPTRRQPVAVLDNKVPSLRLPLSRDGILHSKIEDSLKQPRTTRRSRRLATSQDAVAENSEEKAGEKASPKVTMPNMDSTESDESARGATTENPSLRTSMETAGKDLTKEERMLMNLVNARAVKASKEKRRSRRFFSGHRKRTQTGQSRKRDDDDDMDELAPQPRKRKTMDFVPEILPTKSRTETATLQRRKQMQKEIEQHERERLETARPGEDERLRSPSPLTAEPPDSLQGDDVSTESVTTGSITTASSSRDIDTASKGSSLMDEFPSDIVFRCKRISSQRSCSGDTPLHKVCRTGKYDMARYLLLIEKQPVNVQDYAGWTPLHEACSSSNTRVAELLLQHGADANISATDGTRPIHDAIEVGAFDLVKLLIQYGADPLAEQGEKTPAEFALDMEQPEIHDYLLSVIEKRRAQQSKLAQTASSQPAVAKTPVRKVSEEKKKSEMCADAVMIPVDGYSDDDPKFGDELDHPLFYVSPIIEMSDGAFLPDVYNLEIVSGRNPRRHNFHLLPDVLKVLDISESELRRQCHGIRAVELTVADIKIRLKNSFMYGNSVPYGIRSLPSDTKVKLVPLCTKLRSLFDIEVENMDI